MSLEVGAMLTSIDGSLSASDTSVWQFARLLARSEEISGLEWLNCDPYVKLVVIIGDGDDI